MLTFKEILKEIVSNETLASFLEPTHIYVGDEKMKIISNSVKVFIDPYGSYRFMKFDETGKAIGVLQVVSNKKGVGHMANLYVRPKYRRHGIASELTACAREMFPKKLTASDDRSDDGEAFINHIMK